MLSLQVDEVLYAKIERDRREKKMPRATWIRELMKHYFAQKERQEGP